MRRRIRSLKPSIHDHRAVFSFSANVDAEPVHYIDLGRFGYRVRLTRRFSSDPSLRCIPTESATNTNTRGSQRNAQLNSHELYGNIDLQFREQGLNIINRQRWRNGNFVTLHQRDNVFFNTANIDRMETVPQRGLSLEFPDLRLLTGFKCSVHYAFRTSLVKTMKAATTLTTSKTV